MNTIVATFKVYGGQALLFKKEIKSNIIKIGRHPSSHLHIEDELASRIHAVIEIDNDKATIIDLGNEPCTKVNGSPINRIDIKTGDEILIGNTRVVLESIIRASDEGVADTVLGVVNPDLRKAKEDIDKETQELLGKRFDKLQELLGEKKPPQPTIGQAFTILFLLIPATILMRAFVLVAMWRWFLVPLGLPDVGVAHMIGIQFFIFYSLIAFYKEKKSEWSEQLYNKAIAQAIGVPLLLLFICWILQMFM